MMHKFLINKKAVNTGIYIRVTLSNKRSRRFPLTGIEYDPDDDAYELQMLRREWEMTAAFFKNDPTGDGLDACKLRIEDDAFENSIADADVSTMLSLKYNKNTVEFKVCMTHRFLVNKKGLGKCSALRVRTNGGYACDVDLLNATSFEMGNMYLIDIPTHDSMRLLGFLLKHNPERRNSRAFIDVLDGDCIEVSISTLSVTTVTDAFRTYRIFKI